LSSIGSYWLNRFCSLPSGKEKKQLKGRDLMVVFSVFTPYCIKSLQTLSLFIKSTYASQDI
jgi:hypothetical protein